AHARGRRGRADYPREGGRLPAACDRAHRCLSARPAAARLLPAGRAEATPPSGRRTVSVRFDVDERALAAAADVLEQQRVGILVVAFQAERFIDGVLARIPPELAHRFAEITVIDDSSNDRTFEVAV